MATKRSKLAEEMQEIADKQASEFLGEEVKEGNVVEKENPVEEKAKEIVDEKPKEEVKEEEKPVEDGPEVDLEVFKKEVIEGASDEVKKYLEGKDLEETKDNVDDYTKFAKNLWDKEGRNPTYQEALEFVSNKAVDRLHAEQEAKDKADQEAQQAKVKADEEAKIANQEAEKKQTDAFNALVDEELKELYDNKRIPAIVDQKNPKDEGVVARQALFQQMLEVNEKRSKEGKPLIYSVSRIYHEYYKPPKNEVAGADAPVSAGTGGNAGTGEQGYSHRQIHKASFLDILMGRDK